VSESAGVDAFSRVAFSRRPRSPPLSRRSFHAGLHREATNERIGANFYPSHLYWQGIDVTEAIRFLGERDAIHHVHAKDNPKVYDASARVKGVLDTEPYTAEADRSWLFRSIGYGHGESHWKDIVSTLRMVGYEGALSIEHEDSLTSSREGLERVVDVPHEPSSKRNRATPTGPETERLASFPSLLS